MYSDSLFFASRGANVVLNDLSKQAADAAVSEINKLGKGKAVANYDSAVAGDKIIKQAIDTFGAIHVSPIGDLDHFHELIADCVLASADFDQQCWLVAGQVVQGYDRRRMGPRPRSARQGSLRLLKGGLGTNAQAKVRTDHQRELKSCAEDRRVRVRPAG